MAEHKYGQFNSWEIISDTVARKTCDKSFFQYKGMAIPHSLRWFFGAEDLNVGAQINLVLIYDGFEYDSRITKTDNGANQTRMFWNNELAEEFEPYANDDRAPVLEFERVSDRRYSVKMIVQMDNNRQYSFDQVVAFLRKFSGKQYVEPYKAQDSVYMHQMWGSAEEAMKVLTGFASDVVNQVPGLELSSHTDWKDEHDVVWNSLNVVIRRKNAGIHPYFMCPYFISMAVEKGYSDEDTYFLTISVDIVIDDYYLAEVIDLLKEKLTGDMFCEAYYSDGDYSLLTRSNSNIKPLLDGGRIESFDIKTKIAEIGKEEIIFNNTVKYVKDMRDLYEAFVELDLWWPVLTEYDPGISIQEYHDLLLNERARQGVF